MGKPTDKLTIIEIQIITFSGRKGAIALLEEAKKYIARGTNHHEETFLNGDHYEYSLVSKSTKIKPKK